MGHLEIKIFAVSFAKQLATKQLQERERERAIRTRVHPHTATTKTRINDQN